MTLALNNFSDVNQSGLGALGVNGKAFIIQIISFIIVFLVLKRFAFKPILKLMNDRHNLIEEGVKLGAEMKKKSTELEDEISAKLHEARNDADNIISSAQQDARELVQAAEEGAKTKVEQITKEAQEKIKRDTVLARKQLEGELVDLISEATEAIIDEKIDAKKDSALIEKALKQRVTL